MNSICICGAGTMGSGIAQVAAQSGFHTILYDINKFMLEKSVEGIRNNLQLLADKNKISPDQKDNAVSLLRITSDTNDCIADVFIEAIVENIHAKAALFNQLSEVNHSDAIFASNTSSLSVTAIAAGVVVNPQRVIGMHFFNPAPAMKLVEVVKAEKTNEATIHSVMELAKQMGKTAVLCKDAPGFIVNHVARPYYLEALRLMEQGVAIETIDTLMEASGFKMGPFRLMDLIGNDINYTVSNSLYEALDKPDRLKPSAIQKEKVDKGELGKKSGKGFYDYKEES